MEILGKSKFMVSSTLTRLEISTVDDRPMDMYLDYLEVQLVG